MTTTTARSTKCPIPLRDLHKLEIGLGRDLEGWEQSEPLHHSPSPKGTVEGAWFDIEAVVRVVRAMRRMPHTKGEWRGVPFEPATWQIVWIIAPVFGWKHPDGTRIVREVWDEIPRKNGKSTKASRLMLVLAAADGEMGGEVYSAASSEGQARQVFDEAKVVAEKSPAIRRRADILTSVIRFPRTGSIFRVLSKVAEAAHGLNVSGAVVDEVHVHKSRDLIDAIETGTGARRQPLIVYITTAGSDDDTTIYAEKHKEAIEIAAGDITDPTVWVVIWAAEAGDDPFAATTWAKANPNYPVSPSHEYLERKARKAERTPTFMPVFLRLHLNIRSGLEGEIWPGADAWAVAGNVGLVPDDKIRGRRAWGGLVAASATDLASLAWVLENPEGPGYWAIWRHWIPEDQVAELDRRTAGSASAWVKAGHLIATEGNQLDGDAIVEQIRADAQTFDVDELAFDAGGTSIGITQGIGDDELVDLVAVYASTPGSSLVDFETRLRAGEFNHGGNPIAAWQVKHARVRETGAATMRLDRKGSTENIYGIVAAELALRRALIAGDEPTSAYADHGLTTI